MITTKHKIHRLVQIGEISAEFASELLRYLNDDDSLVSYGIDNIDDCVLSRGDWIDLADSWDCDLDDLELCTISEIVDRIWTDKIHGQYVNTGYGRYKKLHGYAVTSA